MLVFSMAITFLLIMNSAGHILAYHDLLENIEKKRRKFIIMREMTIALGVMIAFHYFGEFLLGALHVETATLHIAGGIILFLISIKMIFPPTKKPYQFVEGVEEPFVVPFAIPMVAGPSVLVTIMIYAPLV